VTDDESMADNLGNVIASEEWDIEWVEVHSDETEIVATETEDEWMAPEERDMEWVVAPGDETEMAPATVSIGQWWQVFHHIVVIISSVSHNANTSAAKLNVHRHIASISF